MNECVANPRDEVARVYEHDGWQISIAIKRMPMGTLAAHADLFRDATHHCSIMLSSGYSDDISATLDLKKRAVAWIDDWNRRDHSGSTGFQNI